MTNLLSKTLFISLLLSAVRTSRAQASVTEVIGQCISWCGEGLRDLIGGEVVCGISPGGLAALMTLEAATEKGFGVDTVATGVVGLGIGELVKIGGYLGSSDVVRSLLLRVNKHVTKETGKTIGKVITFVGGVVAAKKMRVGLLSRLENSERLKRWTGKSKQK